MRAIGKNYLQCLERLKNIGLLTEDLDGELNREVVMQASEDSLEMIANGLVQLHNASLLLPNPQGDENRLIMIDAGSSAEKVAQALIGLKNLNMLNNLYKKTALRAGSYAQLVAEGLGLLNQAGVLSDENKAIQCCNELVNAGNGVKDRVDALISLDKLQKRRLAVHMIAQGSRASHCFFSKLPIDNLSNIAAKVFELNEDQLAIKIDHLNKMHADEDDSFQKSQCIIL